MDAQDSEPEKKPSKGYGKRSRKQWIIIYVVVAIIVYGLIYLIFIRNSSGSGGGLGY
jgi:flagellar basal body-associated protein FliL